MGARLFISYKRSEADDEKLAHRLRDGLLTAGHEVFIDTGMKVGVDWVASVRAWIAHADHGDTLALRVRMLGEVGFVRASSMGEGS